MHALLSLLVEPTVALYLKRLMLSNLNGIGCATSLLRKIPPVYFLVVGMSKNPENGKMSLMRQKLKEKKSIWDASANYATSKGLNFLLVTSTGSIRGGSSFKAIKLRIKIGKQLCLRS